MLNVDNNQLGSAGRASTLPCLAAFMFILGPLDLDLEITWIDASISCQLQRERIAVFFGEYGFQYDFRLLLGQELFLRTFFNQLRVTPPPPAPKGGRPRRWVCMPRALHFPFIMQHKRRIHPTPREALLGVSDAPLDSVLHMHPAAIYQAPFSVTNSTIRTHLQSTCVQGRFCTAVGEASMPAAVRFVLCHSFLLDGASRRT